MSYRKRRHTSLYVFIGVIIAGLVGVQLYWINKTITVEQDTINRQLYNDFSELADKLEENAYCYSLHAKTYVNQYEGVYLIKQKVDSQGRFISLDQGGSIDTINMFNMFTYKGDTLYENYNSIELRGFSSSLDVKFDFGMGSAMNPSQYKFGKLNKDNIKQAFDKAINVDYAFDRDYIDKGVKDILIANDIDTNYMAGIKRNANGGFLFVSDSMKSMKQYANVLKIPFLKTYVNDPYLFIVGVEKPFKKIVASMSVMMVSSVVIILILIISYAYFIRTIIRQRRLSEMKNAFINNITHEFRTPITNINLAIQNWRDTKNNPSFYYDIIAEENRHLENNVDQILQLATLKHNGLTEAHAKVNIHDVIDNALGGFEMQLKNLDSVVTFNANAQEPIVNGNSRELQNMVQNLISNAIKYSSDIPRILITTANTAGELIVAVEDNGIGMPAHVQKNIFDPFYRNSTGDRHDVKGFGLGLSYVKHIVDNHNGRIEVKSKPGDGATFKIYLPNDKR